MSVMLWYEIWKCGSNSLKVWVLFDKNPEKVFSLNYLTFCYHLLTFILTIFFIFDFLEAFLVIWIKNFVVAKSNAFHKVHYINRIQLFHVWFQIKRRSSLPDFKLKRAGQLSGWVLLVHLDYKKKEAYFCFHHFFILWIISEYSELFTEYRNDNNRSFFFLFPIWY